MLKFVIVDAKDRPIAIKESEFSTDFSGVESTTDIIYNDDGTVTINFVAMHHGDFNFESKLAGQNLSNGPVTIKIAEGNHHSNQSISNQTIFSIEIRELDTKNSQVEVTGDFVEKQDIKITIKAKDKDNNNVKIKDLGNLTITITRPDNSSVTIKYVTYNFPKFPNVSHGYQSK